MTWLLIIWFSTTQLYVVDVYPSEASCEYAATHQVFSEFEVECVAGDTI